MTAIWVPLTYLHGSHSFPSKKHNRPRPKRAWCPSLSMAPLLFHASAKQQISYGVDCWALDIGFSAENKSPHWIEKVEIRVFLGKKREEDLGFFILLPSSLFALKVQGVLGGVESRWMRMGFRRNGEKNSSMHSTRPSLETNSLSRLGPVELRFDWVWVRVFKPCSSFYCFLSHDTVLFALKLLYCFSSCYLALGEIGDALKHFKKCLQTTCDVSLDQKIRTEAVDGLQKAQVLFSLYCSQWSPFSLLYVYIFFWYSLLYIVSSVTGSNLSIFQKTGLFANWHIQLMAMDFWNKIPF